MKEVRLHLDYAGRPAVGIYVGVGGPLAARMRASGQPLPVPRRLVAMIDTGASRTVVEEEHLASLGLTPVGETDLYTVSSALAPVKRNLYAVEVALDEHETGTLAKNLHVVAVEGLRGLGVQALLGRDVLGVLEFSFNGPRREFVLRLP